MKNRLKYILNILKVLVWPILFVIGQLLVNLCFVFVFNSKQKNLTEEYMNSLEYQTKLTNYINSNTLLIIIISAVILIPLFYFVFKKYKKKNKFSIKNIVLPILFGITISLIYNIGVFSLNNLIHFTDNYKLSEIPILVQIIASGIIGPIIEELIFRGIVYNKLKEFNKPIVSIILTSIIFGLMHGDIINAIYGFGVSFILIYLYEKYKTLKAPILMHMTLNITTILSIYFIIKNIIWLNIIVVIVCIVILLIIRKKYIKTKE